MNPAAEAGLTSIRGSIAEFRRVVDGLAAEGCNWRPGPDTNSVSVLVHHSISSATFWLQSASSADTDRAAYMAGREASFNFGADSFALLGMLDGFEETVAATALVLANARLDEARSWPGEEAPVTAAWCLVRAVEHLREHLGAAMLTRQLWEMRGRS